MSRLLMGVLAGVAAVGSMAGTVTPSADGGAIQRASIGPGGRQANCGSNLPATSGDGQFVAFQSCASNLVSGDARRFQDVFVHDRRMLRTELVSVGLGGRPANDDSLDPIISRDGRFVAFSSFASNLVGGDDNATADVFVRETFGGTTRRASVAVGGEEADGGSGPPAISADGRFVAFLSGATNLVRDDTNDLNDIFVRDMRGGRTERVSVGPRGQQANGESGGGNLAISGGGRFVGFFSSASNLVPDDANNATDAFVFDRAIGVARRASVGPNGLEANKDSMDDIAMSNAGRFVAFVSAASNLVASDTNETADVFLHDLKKRTTTLVNVGDGGQQASTDSGGVAISGNGRFVGFVSSAPNLIPGDTNDGQDVFVWDLRKRTTRRVSLGSDGQQGDLSSYPGSISADGRFVAFSSEATNLVVGDTNSVQDVFVRRIKGKPSGR